MTKGISKKQLRRYVAMRERIERDAKTLSSFSSLLALFQTSGDDKLEVDPVALGYMHELMEGCVLNIWEALDDFIHLHAARSALKDASEG